MAVLGEPFSELAGRSGFAGALQSADQPYRGRPRRKLRTRLAAEEFGEFVTHDFDDLLIGRKLEQNFGAESFLANLGDEIVGDTKVHVAFEQGFTNFGEGGVEVLFGELALTAKIFESALEFFGECFEHFFLMPFRPEFSLAPCSWRYLRLGALDP